MLYEPSGGKGSPAEAGTPADRALHLLARHLFSSRRYLDGVPGFQGLFRVEGYGA